MALYSTGVSVPIGTAANRPSTRLALGLKLRSARACPFITLRGLLEQPVCPWGPGELWALREPRAGGGREEGGSHKPGTEGSLFLLASQTGFFISQVRENE